MKVYFAIPLHLLFSYFCYSMRWFATIMVIILTVLFVLPCTDGNNRCEGNNVQTSQAGHNHDQDRDDSCSPFCQCACCSISIATFHFTSPEIYVLSQIPVTKNTVIRDVYFVSNYLGSIWQPPQFNA